VALPSRCLAPDMSLPARCVCRPFRALLLFRCSFAALPWRCLAPDTAAPSRAAAGRAAWATTGADA